MQHVIDYLRSIHSKVRPETLRPHLGGGFNAGLKGASIYQAEVAMPDSWHGPEPLLYCAVLPSGEVARVVYVSQCLVFADRREGALWGAK